MTQYLHVALIIAATLVAILLAAAGIAHVSVTCVAASSLWTCTLRNF